MDIKLELPENWLRDGNVWEYRRADDAVIVKFFGDAWMELKVTDHFYVIIRVMKKY